MLEIATRATYPVSKGRIARALNCFSCYFLISNHTSRANMIKERTDSIKEVKESPRKIIVGLVTGGLYASKAASRFDRDADITIIDCVLRVATSHSICG